MHCATVLVVRNSVPGRWLLLFLLCSLFSFAYWFVIPQYSNEAGATTALRHIRTSINKYSQIHGGYPSFLQDVVAEGLLPRELASKVIHNYEFEYVAQKPCVGGQRDTGLYARFYITARPHRFLWGTRTLILNESGVIAIYDSTKSDARVETTIKPPDDWGFQKKPDT